MSVLQDLNPLQPVVEGVINIIGRFIPDKNAAAKAEQELNLLMASAEVQSRLQQLKINEAEAKHKSIFVAGWRPAIGWMGVFAMGLGLLITVLLPAVLIIGTLYGTVDPIKLKGVIQDLKSIDTSFYISITLQLLGFGALRSYEKNKGTDTKEIKGPVSYERKR